MSKVFGKISKVVVVFILASLFALQGIVSADNVQSATPVTAGPSTKNCYSAAYHAATDCDRLASGYQTVQTGIDSRYEQAEASHWAYLRQVFNGSISPYIIPATGNTSP